MVDSSPAPKTQDDMGVRPTHESPHGTPRWVKVFGIILILLILGFVILKLAGVGGDHGPDRHTSSEDRGGLAVSKEVVSAVEVMAPGPEPFGSSRADVFVGQTVAFPLVSGSQAVHESAPTDPAMQRVRNCDPLDHDMQSITGMLLA